jgi:hypothetical protein
MKKLIITTIALLALSSCGTLNSQGSNPLIALKGSEDIREAVITVSKGSLTVKGEEVIPVSAIEKRLEILKTLPHKIVGNKIVWENVTVSISF